MHSDSAGARHGFVDAVVGRGLKLSVGFEPHEGPVAAITKGRGSWMRPRRRRSSLRANSPNGREIKCPGAPGIAPLRSQGQGLRPGRPAPQALLSISPDRDIVYREARYRGHDREEDQIKDAKHCGLAKLPRHSLRPNQFSLLRVQLAQSLLGRAKRRCLRRRPCPRPDQLAVSRLQQQAALSTRPEYRAGAGSIVADLGE